MPRGELKRFKALTPKALLAYVLAVLISWSLRAYDEAVGWALFASSFVAFSASLLYDAWKGFKRPIGRRLERASLRVSDRSDIELLRAIVKASIERCGRFNNALAERLKDAFVERVAISLNVPAAEVRRISSDSTRLKGLVKDESLVDLLSSKDFSDKPFEWFIDVLNKMEGWKPSA